MSLVNLLVIRYYISSSVQNFRDQSAKRLLQGMKTIVAWQTSCRSVFKEARRFQSNQITWELSQFRYHFNLLNPYQLDVQRVKTLFKQWGASDPNLLDDAFIQQIIDRAGRAKIHAEAGLMHWIATVKVGLCSPVFSSPSDCHLQDPNSTRDWPIGVSKKPCHLCWLLHEVYNERRPFSFILPGTHGTFCPWLPPPGLPDSILHKLREELIQNCNKFVPSHSRQSSAGSASSVVDIDNDKTELDKYNKLKYRMNFK